MGIAVSAVPKSHAHVLTVRKLTLLLPNPNRQIFLRITKTDKQIFLAIFNPACQMPRPSSFNFFGHLFLVLKVLTDPQDRISEKEINTLAKR